MTDDHVRDTFDWTDDHVRDTFDWAVEAVERHPVGSYVNAARRIEIAQTLTRLVIELEALVVGKETPQ